VFIRVYKNRGVFNASDIEDSGKKAAFLGQNQGLPIYFLCTRIGVFRLISRVGKSLESPFFAIEPEHISDYRLKS
jgi:hypothetical protein